MRKMIILMASVIFVTISANAQGSGIGVGLPWDGLSYYFTAYPIDIYLEEAPAFYLLGGKGLDLFNLTFGFRYFF